MASNGKRMVKEDLIKKLENLPEGLEVVEANSTDEATETLSKLTVGDTVYAVPQGGGLSNYTIRVEGEDSDTNAGIILLYCTLADNPVLVPGTYTTISTALGNYLIDTLYGRIGYDPTNEVGQIWYDGYFNDTIFTMILNPTTTAMDQTEYSVTSVTIKKETF